MSLPGNVPSSIPLAGLYLPPDDRVTTGAEDFEDGGVAVQDRSQGLSGHTWRIWVDGLDVNLQREGAAATVLFQASGITEVALAFDQSMRPSVAYTVGGTLYLRWYDSVASAYVTTAFGAGKNPRLALDDKRLSQITRSDVIFAYLRNGGLYYRQQRDRYGVEYTLRTGIGAGIRLRNIGMSMNLRMQFELA